MKNVLYIIHIFNIRLYFVKSLCLLFLFFFIYLFYRLGLGLYPYNVYITVIIEFAEKALNVNKYHESKYLLMFDSTEIGQ